MKFFFKFVNVYQVKLHSVNLHFNFMKNQINKEDKV